MVVRNFSRAANAIDPVRKSWHWLPNLSALDAERLREREAIYGPDQSGSFAKSPRESTMPKVNLQ
jgi:hypothetical protein